MNVSNYLLVLFLISVDLALRLSLFGEKNLKQIINLLVQYQIDQSFHSKVEKLYHVTSDFFFIKLLMFCRLELLLLGHNLSCIIHKWHKCHHNHIFIQTDHRWDFTRSFSLVTFNGQRQSQLCNILIVSQYGQLLGHPRQVLYVPSFQPVRTRMFCS